MSGVFPRVFPGFSQGFPGVFPGFSQCFLRVFPGFAQGFQWFSRGFPGIFLGFFRGLPGVFQSFPGVLRKISRGFPLVFPGFPGFARGFPVVFPGFPVFFFFIQRKKNEINHATSPKLVKRFGVSRMRDFYNINDMLFDKKSPVHREQGFPWGHRKTDNATTRLNRHRGQFSEYFNRNYIQTCSGLFCTIIKLESLKKKCSLNGAMKHYMYFFIRVGAVILW